MHDPAASAYLLSLNRRSFRMELVDEEACCSCESEVVTGGMMGVWVQEGSDSKTSQNLLDKGIATQPSKPHAPST